MRIWFPSETGFIKAVPVCVTLFFPCHKSSAVIPVPAQTLSASTGCWRGLTVKRVCCYGDFAHFPESSVLFLPSLLHSPSHLESYSHTCTEINSQLCMAAKRQQTPTETREGLTGYKEKLFPHEDSQALGPVVQGGCTMSIFGDSQAQFG